MLIDYALSSVYNTQIKIGLKSKSNKLTNHSRM